MRPPFENPSREPAIRAPAIVLGLIGLFIVVHLVRLSDFAADEFILKIFAFLPFRSALEPQGLLEHGAVWWTWVTYALIHGDWPHLIINSFWMLAFGSVVAARMGAMRFLIFSAICAAAGAGAYWMLHAGERAILVGASAAISGQMAGAVRLIYAGGAGLGAPGDMSRVRALSLRELFSNSQALFFLAIWAGLNLFFGAGAGAFDQAQIAWEAHFGGFFAGLIFFGWFDRR